MKWILCLHLPLVITLIEYDKTQDDIVERELELGYTLVCMQPFPSTSGCQLSVSKFDFDLDNSDKIKKCHKQQCKSTAKYEKKKVKYINREGGLSLKYELCKFGMNVQYDKFSNCIVVNHISDSLNALCLGC